MTTDKHKDMPPWVRNLIEKLIEVNKKKLARAEAAETRLAQEDTSAPVALPDTRASEAVLIMANLIPIIGVLFWDWQIFDVIMAFWLENVIVGIMNVARMTAYGLRHQSLAAVFIIPFFIFHYGIFTMAHGAFVFFLMSGGMQTGGSVSKEAMLQTLADLTQLWPVVLALLLSHGFSFFVNFLRGGEIDRTDLGQLMHAPYGRVVVLHVTIILGMFASFTLGGPIWVLVLLTVFKITADVLAHRRSHRKNASGDKKAEHRRIIGDILRLTELSSKYKGDKP